VIERGILTPLVRDAAVSVARLEFLQVGKAFFPKEIVDVPIEPKCIQPPSLVWVKLLAFTPDSIHPSGQRPILWPPLRHTAVAMLGLELLQLGILFLPERTYGCPVESRSVEPSPSRRRELIAPHSLRAYPRGQCRVLAPPEWHPTMAVASVKGAEFTKTSFPILRWHYLAHTPHKAQRIHAPTLHRREPMWMFTLAGHPAAQGEILLPECRHFCGTRLCPYRR